MTFLVGAPTAIIVDDDKDTVAVFADYLKLKKINVMGVGFDGKEGLELYKKFKPDIVFLDHWMPEYDGLFALHNIKQIDPKADVVMITADNSIKENSKVMELEPTAIISKPFKIKDVMDLIDSIIKQKAQVKNSN